MPEFMITDENGELVTLEQVLSRGLPPSPFDFPQAGDPIFPHES
jgi:hypothetical protein